VHRNRIFFELVRQSIFQISKLHCINIIFFGHVFEFTAWGRRRQWLALWKNGTASGAQFTSPGACTIQIDSSVPATAHPDVGLALSDEDAASAMAIMLQSCPRDVFVSVLRYL
jgi:hypothetical protein